MILSPLAHRFLVMMDKTVTIEPYMGIAGGGSITPAFGTAKTYPCRVNNEYRQIINHEGQQDISTVALSVYPVASDATVLLALDVRSRVTMPDGTQPIVKQLKQQTDFKNGVLFYTIYS